MWSTSRCAEIGDDLVAERVELAAERVRLPLRRAACWWWSFPFLLSLRIGIA